MKGEEGSCYKSVLDRINTGSDELAQEGREYQAGPLCIWWATHCIRPRIGDLVDCICVATGAFSSVPADK